MRQTVLTKPERLVRGDLIRFSDMEAFVVVKDVKRILGGFGVEVKPLGFPARWVAIYSDVLVERQLRHFS